MIDISKINLEELAGVVNIYPWYGGARKELCRRMSELGDGSWSEDQYAEAALYVRSRHIIADLLRKGRQTDYSDRDMDRMIRTELAGPSKPRVILAGGDFFSPDQYNRVRRSEDSVFSTFARQAREEGYRFEASGDPADFCTETLAEIYLEQGYYEQAKDIYSKLSLRYPEKSVYFATLIEKINNN